MYLSVFWFYNSNLLNVQSKILPSYHLCTFNLFYVKKYASNSQFLSLKLQRLQTYQTESRKIRQKVKISFLATFLSLECWREKER